MQEFDLYNTFWHYYCLLLPCYLTTFSGYYNLCLVCNLLLTTISLLEIHNFWILPTYLSITFILQTKRNNIELIATYAFYAYIVHLGFDSLFLCVTYVQYTLDYCVSVSKYVNQKNAFFLYQFSVISTFSLLYQLHINTENVQKYVHDPWK